MNDTKHILIQNNFNAADPNGTERRHTILMRHREIAEHALSRSNDDSIIICLDLTNCGLSRTIADGKGDAQFNSTHIETCRADGVLATMAIQMKRWDAYKLLSKMQKQLHRLDHRDPKVSSIVERLRDPATKGMGYLLVLSKGKQLVEIPLTFQEQSAIG